jgi:hypothetical protein
MTLDDEDDEFDIEDDGDDSEEDSDSQEDPAAAPSLELDPATKAKLLPMAMMKAKRSIGDETWKSLSSDEKTRLTDAELRKLAAAT